MATPQHTPQTPSSQDVFVSTGKDKIIVARVQKHVRVVLHETYPDIDKLIDTIRSEGLPVFANCPDFQSKLLMMSLGGQPGFVAPTFEHYADLVKFLKKHMPQRATVDFSNGFLFLLKETRQYSVIAYEYYHWLAYRNSLGGYETQARKLYDTFNRKYHSRLTPQFLNKLDSQQANLLRLAIRRDKEALIFIRQAMHEIFIPLNNAKRLDEDGDTKA